MTLNEAGILGTFTGFLSCGWVGDKVTSKADTSEAKQLPDPRRAPEDAADRHRLVADHLPLVHRLCRRFNHSGEPLEDLVQVGIIGLLKAIEKYDPHRGSSFIAFAIPSVLGEIKNHFRDHGWAVKIPRKLQRQKLAVEKVVGSLSQSLGRAPTIAEIAETTGFSEEAVYDTFEIEYYGKPLSLDAEYDELGSEGNHKLLDILGSEDPQFVELETRIALKDALRCLDDREKTIIRLRFYAGLSQTRIAERLGISQVHVSRLQRNALRRLKLILAK